MMTPLRSLVPAAIVLGLCLVIADATPAQERPASDGSIADRQPVIGKHDMVAAANPLAAEAGRQMLRRGGGAIDAAIATQLVLNLVEPQSPREPGP